MEKFDTLEALENAKYNLETFLKQNRQVMNHLSFMTAMSQLTNVIEKLEQEQDDE